MKLIIFNAINHSYDHEKGQIVYSEPYEVHINADQIIRIQPWDDDKTAIFHRSDVLIVCHPIKEVVARLKEA
jgi:hypothetical protein